MASNKNEYQDNFVCCKFSRCVRLTTLPLSFTYRLEIWKPQPPGTSRADLYRDCPTFNNKLHVSA